MKNFLLSLIIMSLLSINLFSQVDDNINTNEETETLFGNGPVKITGFGGPDVKSTVFNKEAGLLVGARGGILFNGTFSVGLAGYGLVTNHHVDYVINNSRNDSLAYLKMGYGGLIFEYSLNPSKIYHFNVGLLTGVGGATYSNNMMVWDENEWDNDWNTYEKSAFFILEPSLGVELNVASFFRIEAYASYKYVSYLDLPKTQSSDISGLSGGLVFKFGQF